MKQATPLIQWPHRGIAITWPYSTEYIDLDFDNLAQSVIDRTNEAWLPDNESDDSIWVQYIVRSEVQPQKDSGYVIQIHYDLELNPALQDMDISWGRADIYISADAESGEVIWYEDEAEVDRSPWNRTDTFLTSSKTRRVKTEIQRDRQSQLRKELLSHEKSCCLTGESTLETLDVAHIIPVSENGADTMSNVLLLRTDLHRLYDRGVFIITPEGKADIRMEDGLSDTYKEILSNVSLEETVLKRVKSALGVVRNRT